MADHWTSFLSRHSGTLNKPRREWSEAEASAIWAEIASGRIGVALYRTIYRRVRRKPDAEDVLQTFLLEMSMDRTYAPRPGGSQQFRKWLHGCLFNHLKAYYSDVARRSIFVEFDGKGNDVSSDKANWAHAFESIVDIGTMLAALEERERTVMDRQLSGETAPEIASALGLSPGNVRQITFRAMRNLRRKFTGPAPAGLQGPES